MSVSEAMPRGARPAPAPDTVGVRLHGATLHLSSNHAPLLDYAVRHLGFLAGPATGTPDLAVHATWTAGGATPAAGWENARPLTVIGKRMRGDAAELQWLDTLRMDGLRLRFGRDADRWRFDVDYHYRPKKQDGVPIEGYEAKRYFSLMSYLVYYPLLWHLGRTRGWAPLHASSLATPRGGVLLAGLGGVGKTTTCIALLREPGVSLLSENISLTDGVSVYGCHEPIRLDDDSVALLGEQTRDFVALPFEDGLKKKQHFHPRIPPAERAEPRVILLPEFSSRRGLVPIAPELAAEKMVAMNRLTRELDDLGWYAAALDLHWPQPGRAVAEAGALAALARRARCFTLRIDRSAGIDAVVSDVRSALAS